MRPTTIHRYHRKTMEEKLENQGGKTLTRNLFKRKINIVMRPEGTIQGPEEVTKMKWTLLEIHDIAKDEAKLIEYLQTIGVFPKSVECPHSHGELKLVQQRWRCRRMVTNKEGTTRCNYQVSLRKSGKSAWFTKSKWSLGNIMKATYMLLNNFEQHTVAYELKINKKSLHQWMEFIRKVLQLWSVSTSQRVGGVGKTVEIDESKFGCQKKGKGIKNGQEDDNRWIFGGVERDSGKFFMVGMESREPEILLAIIKQWIEPGTTIISDCWSGHEELRQKLAANNYIHITTANRPDNISANLKTAIHTNTIRCMWRHTKKFLPRNRRKEADYNGYLAHYMFVKHCKIMKEDILDSFLKLTIDLEPMVSSTEAMKIDVD